MKLSRLDMTTSFSPVANATLISRIGRPNLLNKKWHFQMHPQGLSQPPHFGRPFNGDMLLTHIPAKWGYLRVSR
jgi:hypothetical protein